MEKRGEVTPTAGWADPAQVEWYTQRIGKLEARLAGEQMMIESLPPAPLRVLDLGCGDGRLSALALAARPSIAEVVAIDRSEPMLERARARFRDEPRVRLRRWDLQESINELGQFDLVLSGFAIHHLEHDRKQTLFAEVVAGTEPLGSGLFLNLEVVASATPELHARFLAAIGRTADDPEDRLASVEDQLGWMGQAGMTGCDCLWRWRGFALLAGWVRPTAPQQDPLERVEVRPPVADHRQ